MGQDATPVAAPDGAITLVAGQLQNPRGFAWGEDGLLYVSLAGNGGTTITTSDDSSPEDQVVGPTMTGQTASVVQIVDGCGVPFVTGLPSTADPYGDVQGPVDVAFLNDQMHILQDATGGYEAVGPDFPNGIYTLNPDSSVRLISDLSAYVAAKPAGNLYHVLELGEPFAFAPGDGGFWVVDANQGLLLWVAVSGQVTLIADLSEGHPVPTALTVAPDGAVYVGFLTPGPHIDGTSKVVRIDPEDYSVTDYWTGLTTVTGLATDIDGNLYALEMATGNQTTEPNIFPDTGRLVRQTGPNSMDVLVTGLDFPISMDSGPDGALLHLIAGDRHRWRAGRHHPRRSLFDHRDGRHAGGLARDLAVHPYRHARGRAGPRPRDDPGRVAGGDRGSGRHARGGRDRSGRQAGHRLRRGPDR